MVEIQSGSLVALEEEVADTLAPEEAVWNSTRDRRAEIRDGDVYLVDPAEERTRRVTATVVDEHSVQITPNGHTVFFVQDDNLYGIEWRTGMVRQLTNLKLAEEQEEDDRQ